MHSHICMKMHIFKWLKLLVIWFCCPILSFFNWSWEERRLLRLRKWVYCSNLLEKNAWFQYSIFSNFINKIWLGSGNMRYWILPQSVRVFLKSIWYRETVNPTQIRERKQKKLCFGFKLNLYTDCLYKLAFKYLNLVPKYTYITESILVKKKLC